MTKQEPTVLRATKMDEAKPEMMYAVSILKHSEVEKKILPIGGLTKLEPDPERPELRFMLVRKTTQKKLIKLFPTQISRLGQRFRCGPLPRKLKMKDLEIS